MSSSREQGRRFAVVTNIPTPYRLPLFDELARQLAEVGDELLVIFAAAGYARRQWEIDLDNRDFRFEILGNRRWSLRSRGESALFTYRGLSRVLRREQPSAVLVGGFNAATTRLWLARGTPWRPYLIWSGAISSPHIPVGSIRQWHRRRVIAGAEGFAAYGTRARDYLVELGAPPERVEIAMNTVDVSHFVEETDRLRGTLEAAAPHRLLYVGDLSERKRPDRVIDALAKLRPRTPRIQLTLVGDGPNRLALENQAKALGLAEVVRFEGFRQQAEIPRFLAAADAFLFPTAHDVWGLVLVEAMAAGLPCLSSPHAGATADLVRDGETGFSIDFADPGAVAGRLDWLFDHPEQCRAIGARARQLIEENVTLSAAAAACLRAFHRAVEPAQ